MQHLRCDITSEQTKHDAVGLSSPECCTTKGTRPDESTHSHRRLPSLERSVVPLSDCSMDLPTISAFEVDAILGGLSSTNATSNGGNGTLKSSTFDADVCTSTMFENCVFQAEHLTNPRGSATDHFIDSSLDIKTQDILPKVTTSNSSVYFPVRKTEGIDDMRLNNQTIPSSSNIVIAQAKKCVINSIQEKRMPTIYKDVFISNPSYSLEVSKTSAISVNATSRRDRSPIGSLDLATQTDFLPASVNKIGSREANWAIRVAGLPRIQNTKLKKMSASTHTAAPKACTSIRSPQSTQDAPVLPPIAANNTHRANGVQCSSSTGCNDRFKHICPYPHCGRRYQAEFGLLRHLGKYHLDRVELPQRKRPSIMGRHTGHRRPASEERPIASSISYQTDEPASEQAFHRQCSSRPTTLSNIRVVDTMSREERSTYLGNNGGTPSVRLIPTEQSGLPNKASDTHFRLRIVQPRWIKYNSNRSVSLTVEPVNLDSSTVNGCHTGSPNRPRSVSGDVHPKNENLSLQLRSQNRHRSDDSSPLPLPTSTYAPCNYPCGHTSCQTKPPPKSPPWWDDTHVNFNKQPVCSGSSDSFHSNILTASDDEQFIGNRRRNWSVGAGLHGREVMLGNLTETASSHHCVPQNKASRYTDVKHVADNPRISRIKRSGDAYLGTSTSDDESTKQMEFISGVHALTYSKSDSITCPIDGCTHVSSGRADLSAHLTGIHFPEVKNQLVRLIFACPVKDCPTVCDDEVAFQVHFNRHLFGCLPLDLTDLSSAIRSPVSPGTAHTNPMSQATDKASKVAAMELVQQNLSTKLLLTPATDDAKCIATSSQPVNLQSNELSTKSLLSDILDPTSQLQCSSGRVECNQMGNTKVRFGDDSFIEKEISGLLNDGGNPDLTDHCNLLSALDLIPDSLLVDLLKEERPWWVEATTNCPPAPVTSQRDQSAAEPKCCPDGHTETPQDHSLTSECDQHATDLVNTSTITTNETDCFTDNATHSDEYFSALNPPSPLCSGSWVPSDVVQQTWSSAVANERPLTSMEPSCQTHTSQSQSVNFTDCPHHVLSDLTAALILPDVERRLKVAMSNSHHQCTRINQSATQLDLKDFEDLYCSGFSTSKISDLRNGREMCCTLKRRRNASESSPSSPVTPRSMSGPFISSSFLAHLNEPVKQSTDCSKPISEDGNGVDQLTPNHDSKGHSIRSSTVFPNSDDQHHPTGDRLSCIPASNASTQSGTVVTSASVIHPALPKPTPSASALPSKFTVNSSKICHPRANLVDTSLDSDPSDSLRLMIPGQHNPTAPPPDVTAKSHLSQKDPKKRRRRQQQQKSTPSPIFSSSLRVIAVTTRPLVSLNTSSINRDNFTASGVSCIADNSVVFDTPVSSKQILLPRRNPLVSCHSIDMPHQVQ